MTDTTIRLHGCHNRKPFADTVLVRRGWHYTTDGDNRTHRTEVLRTIPNPMSKHCQYTLHQDNRTDPRCADCYWKAA